MELVENTEPLQESLKWKVWSNPARNKENGSSHVLSESWHVVAHRVALQQTGIDMAHALHQYGGPVEPTDFTWIGRLCLDPTYQDIHRPSE